MADAIARGEERFKGQLEAVRAARRFLRTELDGVAVPEPPLEDALLLASELVTNAVLHAQSDVVLRYAVQPDCVHVEVADGDPRRPSPSAPSPDATSGRGLRLVETIADQWGAGLAFGQSAGKTLKV